MVALVARRGRGVFLLVIMFMCVLTSMAQQAVDVTAHLEGIARNSRRAPYAALWLVPIPKRPVAVSFPETRKYTLLQKNKMFSPHLLIVPVGAVVSFPNADPFFHNVFSLFDGKRFDLGLYEAGSTKEVTFSREGVSYIFCNIHPEMSAVVLALATPYFTIGDDRGVLRLNGVPPGSYQMHVWVEGEEQSSLVRMTRTVNLARNHVDLGGISIAALPAVQPPHTNKFGERYDPTPPSPY